MSVSQSHNKYYKHNNYNSIILRTLFILGAHQQQKVPFIKPSWSPQASRCRRHDDGRHTNGTAHRIEQLRSDGWRYIMPRCDRVDNDNKTIRRHAARPERRDDAEHHTREGSETKLHRARKHHGRKQALFGNQTETRRRHHLIRTNTTGPWRRSPLRWMCFNVVLSGWGECGSGNSRRRQVVLDKSLLIHLRSQFSMVTFTA